MMNLYVDDISNTFDYDNEAIEFYEKSKHCLADAKFELRKWASNNKNLQQYIDKNENKITTKTNSLESVDDDQSYVKT